MNNTHILFSLLGSLLVVSIVVFSRVEPATVPIAEEGQFSDREITRTSVNPSRENVNHSFAASEQKLLAATALNPSDSVSIRQLADLYFDAHQMQKSAELYARYLSLQPEGRQQWLDLAAAYGSLKEWEKALATTEEFLVRWPKDPSGLYNLGAIYANTGNYPEAAHYWHEVINLNSDATISEKARHSLTLLGG